MSDPVAHDEVLVRLVMDPEHLHQKDGRTRLRSSFLTAIADAGTSTLRFERASPDEYQETARLIIEENPTLPDGTARRVYGVVKIPMTMLVKHESEIEGATKKDPKVKFRSVCIYATGEPTRPNHADILLNCITAHKLKRSKQIRIAQKIAEIIENDIITVEDFKAVVDLANIPSRPVAQSSDASAEEDEAIGDAAAGQAAQDQTVHSIPGPAANDP